MSKTNKRAAPSAKSATSKINGKQHINRTAHTASLDPRFGISVGEAIVQAMTIGSRRLP